VAAVTLLAALGAPALLRAEGEWQPSTLSEATLAKVHEAAKAYQDCLNEEFRSSAPTSTKTSIRVFRPTGYCMLAKAG
jgi:hypothetical protein